MRVLVTYPLTDHELDILSRMAEGSTHGEIATQLQISPRTVRNIQGRIYEKLGVRSGMAAVATGFRQGLLR